MSTQNKIISALIALLLIVLATWGAREHVNRQTLDIATTSMRQASTLASMRSLQVQSLQATVDKQTLIIQMKDEQIRLATKTETKVVTVKAPDGTERTESDTTASSNSTTETHQLDLNQDLLYETQTQMQAVQLVALTATAEVQRLQQASKALQLDQVKSAPKLALLFGYDLAALGNEGAPDWLHRARVGLGWPIGLATLGADIAPAYVAAGQWTDSRPQARLDFLFR